MYFKQICRNAAKNRKDNGLFFGCLVVSIVAFYTLLSLGEQDVMRYLKTIESDALGKLMSLIPVVYLVSLFFVFFLVYFACRYQLDNRKKEFGLYLMLGMKQSRLFFMLLGETIISGLVSLLMGLPIAFFLVEVVSLTTVKLVGLDLAGHQINLSWFAVLGSIIGFVAVQVMAMTFLCSRICRKEPLELFEADSDKRQVSLSRQMGGIGIIISLTLLSLAYFFGIRMLSSLKVEIVILVVGSGIMGSFLFFRSVGAFIGYGIKKKSRSKTGLFSFTGRQLQENVLHEHRALAVSSLLLLMAIACVSFGIGVIENRQSNTRTVDFSIMGGKEEIASTLDAEENAALVSTYYPMNLSTSYESDAKVFWDGLIEALKAQPSSDQRDNLIERLTSVPEAHVISVSSYNKMLRSLGKEAIQLEEGQIALYTSMSDLTDFVNVVKGALESRAYIEIDHQKRELATKLYTDNVVSDRLITIYLGYIVSDEDYQKLCDDSEPYCWNVLLKQNIIEKKGLLGAIEALEKNLSKTNLEYESYINGIGRNLFYTVAASYITIYLGVLFMVIANTVIGLKYLMQQRANRHRYITLLMLGAKTDELCKSAKKQIVTFFLLTLGLAVCSSFFAVWAMFKALIKLPAGTTFTRVAILGFIAFVLLMIIEFIYGSLVIHSSRHEISKLQVTDERTE